MYQYLIFSINGFRQYLSFLNIFFNRLQKCAEVTLQCSYRDPLTLMKYVPFSLLPKYDIFLMTYIFVLLADKTLEKVEFNSVSFVWCKCKSEKFIDSKKKYDMLI